MNKVAYLTAISEHIRMTNCIAIKGQEKHCVSDAIELIIKQYDKKRFQVKTMFGDNEFKPIKGWLIEKKIDIETCDAKAHVPTIKRTNRFFEGDDQVYQVQYALYQNAALFSHCGCSLHYSSNKFLAKKR